MDLKDLQLDLNASEDGVFFPFSDDCEIKIAQWGNKAHKKFLREMYTKHGRKIDAGAVSDSQADLLMSGQWQHIVKDWNGMTEGGKTLKFSPKVIKDLATNPQYKSFFEKIASLAREEENFRTQNIKELGEDLPTS